MKHRFFPYIIALSAALVSASAGYYSVYGLSQLFAGASLQVIIMASSLEFAKLVTASLLYRYWDTLNRVLKSYLLVATSILMLITSGGIYGFLSGAYQETATKSTIVDQEVAILDAKQSRFEEQRDYLRTSIQTMTEALANPTVTQYVDRKTGQVVSTTSAGQRRVIEAELKASKDQLPAIEDSIASYDIAMLNLQTNNESARELGPLKYLAELTNVEMNKVVNWFLLLIVFVFDPLAISLVVAANFAFNQLSIKESTIVSTDNEEEVSTLDIDTDDSIVEEEVIPEPVISDNVTIAEQINKDDLQWLQQLAKQEQEREDIYKDRLKNRNSYWTNS
jgi:hypothetical protein